MKTAKEVNNRVYYKVLLYLADMLVKCIHHCDEDGSCDNSLDDKCNEDFDGCKKKT